ncbi:MAG: VCBS repeat-containing protein [candidate division WOR-3 bacterium]
MIILKGGENMRGFILLLILFSISNAQSQSVISFESPFLNKIIENSFYKSDSNEFVISANLTFIKSLVCSYGNSIRVVKDRNDIITDFDGNGRNDIPFIGVSPVLGYVFVAFQSSAGGFQCKIVSNQHNNPYGISVGDFNGDGRKDLVFVSALEGSAHMLINNGAQNFTEQLINDTGGFVNHIGVRNPNLGPNAEIIYTDEYYKVYSYTPSTGLFKLVNNQCREGLAIADLNNDGSSDLVCGTTNGLSGDKGYIRYQLNIGGNWSGLYPVTNIFANWHGIVTADFNKDGKIDVASCRADTSRIYIFYNNGGNPPTFSLSTFIQPGPLFQECELAVSDLDCDGDYDIVWAKGSVPYGATVGWLENNYPNNTWTNRIIESATYGNYGVVVGCVNQDRKPDVVASLDGYLYVWYNTSNINEELCQPCLPVTPVNTPEKSKVVSKIQVNRKEIKIILNTIPNDKLYVYDITGKKLHSYNLNKRELIFNLPKDGIYIIKLRNEIYKVLIN